MKIRILSVLLIAFSIKSFAQIPLQKKTDKMKGIKVVCPATYIDANTFVDMPADVKNALENKRLRIESTQKATFIVTYDSDFPTNAKAAFQRAIDIWAELLSSPVPIRIAALWSPLGRNVLGSASSADYLRNFPGSVIANTWYPIAIAEKLAGKELNSVNDFDIVAEFSSDSPWYYGQTGTPAVGQFDFTSVVLHEMCHGLGFVGSMTVSGSNGSYGYGSGSPFIFDTYIQNEAAKNLTDTVSFKNSTVALRNELISNSLYFDSPRTTAPVLDDKVKLYAPTVFEPGSSISHLDDKKYPAGTINSLMTPTARLREVNRNPGPATMNMFADMGWKRSSIVHTPIKDLETATSVKIEAKILSDTSLVANSAKLIYTINPPEEDLLKNAIELPLVLDAKTGMHTATIPITNPQSVVVYYLSVQDNFKNTATSPPSAPRYIWAFNVGTKDTFGPVVEHYPPDFYPTDQPVSFLANVIDDYQAGIDTVYVNYTVNGQAKAPFGLKKFDLNVDNTDFSQGRSDENAYLAEFGIAKLAAGDKVQYQVVAIDKAKNKTVIPTYYAGTNQTDKPVETTYEFVATNLKTPVTQYFTDFEATNDDFATIGFGISKPDGFASNSLHSSNPYKNGKGLLDPVSGGTYLDFAGNEMAMLRVPIILKKDSANITYDEVVLVEPGESGSVYGDDDFYDYVVVEASLGNGFWFPLQDGYDSRADTNWERVFNSGSTTGTAPNSTGKGAPSLYKTRKIEILGEDLTVDDDGSPFLIRFRLYSDQFVNGWGWSIDNLAVQKPAPKALANENNIDRKSIFSISPNPSTDYVNLKLPVTTPQKIKLEVFSLKGESMYSEEIQVDGPELEKQLNVKNYVVGTYLARVTLDKGQITKRFIVRK
jgi:hypothetical protein